MKSTANSNKTKGRIGARSRDAVLATRITAPQHRHMAAAINARIAHYLRCRPLLRHLTADVLSAGRDIFTSEAVLAIWLCEPAIALDGATPISLVRRTKGRARVIELLRAIAHGVYL